MQFSGFIFKCQLKSPKRVIIRAGTDIAAAENGGLSAGVSPSVALRKELFEKLLIAFRDGADSIELKVEGNVIVASGATLPDNAEKAAAMPPAVAAPAVVTAKNESSRRKKSGVPVKARSKKQAAPKTAAPKRKKMPGR